ncbi:MAG: hypothetical protein ACI8ZO_001689 [Flavobacteriales bacterium]|jgi:hypothetical protein
MTLLSGIFLVDFNGISTVFYGWFLLASKTAFLEQSSISKLAINSILLISIALEGMGLFFAIILIFLVLFSLAISSRA